MVHCRRRSETWLEPSSPAAIAFHGQVGADVSCLHISLLREALYQRLRSIDYLFTGFQDVL